MKLILASNNAKKLDELRVLLAPLPVELVSQGSLGIAEAAEPFSSFIENALAKARQAAEVGGCAAIADDSGLCVEALGGAPGVISAHFAELQQEPIDRELQRRMQDAANNVKLLAAMRGRTDRRARFVSVLVAVRHADDPEPLITSGRWEGELLEEPRGEGGFGYDPLLYIPALSRSVAELDAVTKNTHSHRALAAAAMASLMRATWRFD